MHRLVKHPHLKRILLGVAFGLMVAFLCPRLPPDWQWGCRVILAAIHGMVNS
jgi:hypothetical protein